MIDTIEKLNAVVAEHKNKIVARAMDEYVQVGDDDVWGTYFFDGGEIDFNIYRCEDDSLDIVAYALKRLAEHPPYMKTVNTELSVFIAYVDFKEK